MTLKKLSLFMLCIALGCALTAFAEDTSSSTKTTVPATAAMPEVDHMVYLSFLPSPDELMKDAAANGLTVLRLDHTAEKVVVSYKYPDGHTATLGYALLSASGKAERIAAQRRVVESVSDLPPPSSTTEVVYVERPYPRTRVVYRDSRWDDFWPPLVLGLGIGYVSGHHGHHGHYRHYHGHPRHGPWRHR